MRYLAGLRMSATASPKTMTRKSLETTIGDTKSPLGTAALDSA
jgi:hypothetical protein